MIAGKVWGQTELIEANGALEFHRIEMNTGGVCSKHLHEFKWNGFYVESGSMLIRVWQKDYDLVDETVLVAGDYTKVKPGVYHQFECLEHTPPVFISIRWNSRAPFASINSVCPQTLPAIIRSYAYLTVD